jgi:hypothetical protein
MNLFLALAWLALAITVLAWQWFTGDRRLYFSLGDYLISYAYLMFLLVAYNMSRWWRVRSARRQRRQQEIEGALRQRNSRRKPREEPPNPELNFTGEAPPAPTPPDGSDRAASAE